MPVAIAIELKDPDVIGEHRAGSLDLHQHDDASPDLRAGVEEHGKVRRVSRMGEQAGAGDGD